MLISSAEIRTVDGDPLYISYYTRNRAKSQYRFEISPAQSPQIFHPSHHRIFVIPTKIAKMYFYTRQPLDNCPRI